MFVASLRTTAVIALVFVLLAATLFLLGIGNANESNGLIEVGGWCGLATAVAAWYASFAAVTNYDLRAHGAARKALGPLTELR